MQGCELRDLVVRAEFSIDSDRASVVEKTASPPEADARGHARALVTYPSMLEIWPEAYGMSSIRVIEVCVPPGGCRYHRVPAAVDTAEIGGVFFFHSFFSW